MKQEPSSPSPNSQDTQSSPTIQQPQYTIIQPVRQGNIIQIPSSGLQQISNVQVISCEYFGFFKNSKNYF